MSVSQPLKWHGGKGAFNGKLAKWIISLMPPHVHYVEPYFGGGSVLLHKEPEGVSEVINDVHGKLTNFWKVLQDDFMFERFQRIVQATPFSELEFWEASRGEHRELILDTMVAEAVRFFAINRQSRQGLMKDFATLSKTRTRRGMNEQVSSWLTAVEGLPEVHDRLKRVVILNSNAIDVIRREDTPVTCFYLDPPYLHETRTSSRDYEREMSKEDHELLLLELGKLSGVFLLSGYRSEMYDDAAELYGWRRHDFEIVNNASGKSRKDVKTECIWTNSTGS